MVGFNFLNDFEGFDNIWGRKNLRRYFNVLLF